VKWITREQIRVNRTATCWLIRRFLDPEAEFIFVPADKVASMQTETGQSVLMRRGQPFLTKMQMGYAPLRRWCKSDWPTIESYSKCLGSFKRRISRES
jgi:hypothetical protein